MIKVNFDYKVFFEQSLGGVSKYIHELTNELNTLDCNAKILSPFHINNYLISNNFAKTVYKFNLNYPRYTRKIIEEINKAYIKLYLKKNIPNIFHYTDFNKDYLENDFCKKVLTVYDLIHEKYHNFYKLPEDYKIKKKFFLEKMDHIICISENTKKDLIECYQLNEKKISVVYLGVRQERVTNLKKFTSIAKKPYILFVGYRKKYKNFFRFIKAFSNSKNLLNEYDIVCFGNEKFDNEELSLIKKYELNNNIYIASGNDDDLNDYYKNAKLFIFPSLYEGFGLPLLEAMKNGCPVCCSDTSSLSEIGKNAVDFFNPNSEDSIKNSIEKILYSDDYRKKLIYEGYKKVSNFTWNACAQKTLEIYRNLNA